MMKRMLVSITALALLAAASLPVLAEDAPAAQKLPVTKNLKIWLSADAGVTTDESGKISGWSSQVEPKLKFMREDVVKQPSFAKDAMNGRPAVNFDGTNDSMLCLELPNDLAGDLTVFIVWGSSVEQKNGGAKGGLSNRLLSGANDEGNDYQTGLSLGVGTGEATKPCIVTKTFKVGQPLKYMGIGDMTSKNSAGGFPLTGDISEILIYNAPLSDADKDAVSKYLMEKYKITQ